MMSSRCLILTYFHETKKNLYEKCEIINIQVKIFKTIYIPSFLRSITRLKNAFEPICYLLFLIKGRTRS